MDGEGGRDGLWLQIKMWRLSNEREIYEGRKEGVCVTIGEKN